MDKWLERYESKSEENRLYSKQVGIQIEVAEILGEALRKSGMTKAEFAKRLNTSKGYITRLLSGDYNLSLAQLTKLADCLGFDIEISLKRTGKKPGVVVPIGMVEKGGK